MSTSGWYWKLYQWPEKHTTSVPCDQSLCPPANLGVNIFYHPLPKCRVDTTLYWPAKHPRKACFVTRRRTYIFFIENIRDEIKVSGIIGPDTIHYPAPVNTNRTVAVAKCGWHSRASWSSMSPSKSWRFRSINLPKHWPGTKGVRRGMHAAVMVHSPDWTDSIRGTVKGWVIVYSE